MLKSLNVISLLTTLLATSQVFAFNLKNGYYLAEVGFEISNQSYTQDINIKGLIGDRFMAVDSESLTGLFGLGYLVRGYNSEKFGIDFGLNGFYLSNSVTGTIIQEHLFPNLAYSYKVNHFPLYATAKLHVKIPLDKMALTLDAGLGPNFMKTSSYKDWPLDPIILRDNAFSGHTSNVLSTMAGFGLRLPPIAVLSSFEFGYRYFYLGQGDFNSRTNQILNTLKTGKITSHAFILTATM